MHELFLTPTERLHSLARHGGGGCPSCYGMDAFMWCSDYESPSPLPAPIKVSANGRTVTLTWDAGAA